MITVGAVKTEKAEKGSCSGAGPTKECVVKPDVIAPGYQIISCNSQIHGKKDAYKKRKFYGDSGRVRCCCFIDGKISGDYQCRGEIKTQGDVHTFTRSRRTGVGNVECLRFSETLEV